jgi:hypothetical protein
MTQSLRKATLALALVGGSAFAVALPGIANAGAPEGYFSNSYRYFGPALPPPAYAEIIPVYPAPIYPAPAYAAPAYDPPAMIDYEDGYGYAPGEDFDYFTPDGTLAVGDE